MLTTTACDASLTRALITHTVCTELAGLVTESLARGTIITFVTQNVKINLLPLSLEGTMGQTVYANKAGGHVVVYVRATCWVGPSKWPLLGHFRP